VRTLKPEGLLAIFYGNWLRPMYLSGYSRIEHLICAARETAYARERLWQGAPHPERALGWLQRAGLTSCAIQVLPVVYRQPLPAEVRRYITDAIRGGHYVRAVAAGDNAGMTAEDLELWRGFANPESPDFLLDQPDYCCALTPPARRGPPPGHHITRKHKEASSPISLVMKRPLGSHTGMQVNPSVLDLSRTTPLESMG
jgi:hypothetical protein